VLTPVRTSMGYGRGDVVAWEGDKPTSVAIWRECSTTDLSRLSFPG
jgi:hypothetical protein